MTKRSKKVRASRSLRTEPTHIGCFKNGKWGCAHSLEEYWELFEDHEKFKDGPPNMDCPRSPSGNSEAMDLLDLNYVD